MRNDESMIDFLRAQFSIDSWESLGQLVVIFSRHPSVSSSVVEFQPVQVGFDSFSINLANRLHFVFSHEPNFVQNGWRRGFQYCPKEEFWITSAQAVNVDQNRSNREWQPVECVIEELQDEEDPIEDFVEPEAV